MTRREQQKRGRRQTIPVDEAVQLYDKLGTWSKVASVLKRPDGSRFTPQSIFSAVRWRDRGNAGFKI